MAELGRWGRHIRLSTQEVATGTTGCIRPKAVVEDFCDRLFVLSPLSSHMEISTRLVLFMRTVLTTLGFCTIAFSILAAYPVSTSGECRTERYMIERRLKLRGDQSSPAAREQLVRRLNSTLGPPDHADLDKQNAFLKGTMTPGEAQFYISMCEYIIGIAERKH